MNDSQHPEALLSAGHHWHLVGAAQQQVYLACCTCDYTVIVDSPAESGFLRYSLMEGPRLVGQGRGFLLGACVAGQRALTLDGHEPGSCSLLEGEYGLKALGLVWWQRSPQ